MDAKERETAASKSHELWIDIGAKSKKDAAAVVDVGDVVTIDSGWTELRNGLIACRGFDNRIGAFIVADVLRLLKSAELNVAVRRENNSVFFFLDGS